MSQRWGGEVLQALASWILCISGTIALVSWTGLAIAALGPSALLYGATLEQARDLAVSSALERGWRLVSSASDSATFEHTLEGGDDTGTAAAEAPASHRVIRVRAQFSREAGGVRVRLSADEITSPGQPEERSADVTDQYGLNLANALSALRERWDGRRPPPAAPTTEMGLPGSDTPRPGPDVSQSSGVVGTWAYYAERYAESQGCVLAASGARLESAGAEWERHRVPCQDGTWLHVYCRFGDCTAAPP
jgi:hypothetical protein